MSGVGIGIDFVRECAENILKVGAKRPDPSNLSTAAATEDAGPVLPLDERVALINSVGEEVIGADEIPALLAHPKRPVCYDGFEPSGRMHIAQGILKAINVNKLTKAGCDFIFWVADWFALLNNKMGGDLRKIRIVGQYMIEVWKACGMDMRHVRFVWCADEINGRSEEYWPMVLDIARHTTIARIRRCSTIMGREEGDDQPAAQIFYAAMQCADIFFLRADICQLGMDQRKVNMLAREYAADRGLKSPIIVSHHMMQGLTGEKMSKSNPDSAIFMEDSAEEVERKIKSAFCEPGNVEKNPILDYCKYLVFASMGAITINSKAAGPVVYNSYDELHAAFAAGAVHPAELKPAVAAAINTLVEPVRHHFATNAEARDLLRQVQSFRVTR